MLRAPWSLSESEARILIILLLESMRAEFAVELRTEPNVAVQWEELRLKAYQSSVEIRSSDGQKGVKGAKGIRAWDGVKGRRVKFLARLLTKTAGLAVGDSSTIDEVQGLLRELWEALKSARARITYTMAFSCVPEMRCASTQIGGVSRWLEKAKNYTGVKNVDDTRCCRCESCARGPGATATCAWWTHMIRVLLQTTTELFTKRKCHLPCEPKSTRHKSIRRKPGSFRLHSRLARFTF